MDNIKVDLIQTPDLSLEVMAAIIGVTYIRKPFSVIKHEMTKEKAVKLITNVVEMDHKSTIEHAHFTFTIEGASRVFLAQITRARMANYTSGSQQYQNHGNFSYVLPHSTKKWTPSTITRYHQLMQDVNDLYKDMLASGVDRDDARYVIPNACRVTTIVMTMDVRNLFNLFKQRLCKRNTYETLLVVSQMYAMVHNLYPELFDLSGPACLHGPCDQGSKSCKCQYEYQEELANVAQG